MTKRQHPRPLCLPRVAQGAHQPSVQRYVACFNLRFQKVEATGNVSARQKQGLAQFDRCPVCRCLFEDIVQQNACLLKLLQLIETACLHLKETHVTRRGRTNRLQKAQRLRPVPQSAGKPKPQEPAGQFGQMPLRLRHEAICTIQKKVRPASSHPLLEGKIGKCDDLRKPGRIAPEILRQDRRCLLCPPFKTKQRRLRQAHCRSQPDGRRKLLQHLPRGQGIFPAEGVIQSIGRMNGVGWAGCKQLLRNFRRLLQLPFGLQQIKCLKACSRIALPQLINFLPDLCKRPEGQIHPAPLVLVASPELPQLLIGIAHPAHAHQQIDEQPPQHRMIRPVHQPLFQMGACSRPVVSLHFQENQ